MVLFMWILVVACCLLLLIVFLSVFAPTKSPVRYYSCYIIYLAHYCIISTISIPFLCLNPRSVKNSVYVSKACKVISHILGIKWELRGADILSQDRGAVIVANHQSALDALGMNQIWHIMDKCAPVAKKEVFHMWPFGLLCWLCGAIFIDRLNSKQAYKELNKTGELIKNEKIKLWVFPEGTRNSKTNSLLPFKRGAFRIAIACQVPIIPVIFSPYYFIDHRRKQFGRGKIIITALPEIPTEGLTMDDLESLMENTRSTMVGYYRSVCDNVTNTCCN